MPIRRIRTLSTGVAGAPFYTNIYYDTATGSAQQCADRVRLFWNQFATLHVNGLVHTVQPDVAVINEFTGDVTGIETVTVTPVTCTRAGDPLPSYCQALVRMRTDGVVRGRRVQGRIFVPGWTEDNNAAGRPTGTGILTAGAILRDAGTGARPVVWSRPLTVFGTAVAGSAHAVTDFSGSSTWSVLRSRRS